MLVAGLINSMLFASVGSVAVAGSTRVRKQRELIAGPPAQKTVDPWRRILRDGQLATAARYVWIGLGILVLYRAAATMKVEQPEPERVRLKQ